MAAPTYNTDLGDIATFESATTLLEFTGYAQGDGGALETDWFLQGSQCISDEANNKTGVGHSLGVTSTAWQSSYTAGECFFAWMMCQAPNAMNTYANGGYRVLIGTAAGTFGGWAVGGSDFARNPYGGWTCVVVDPTLTTDYGTFQPTTTNMTSTVDTFGVAWNLTSGISKGRPLTADAYRFGRGETLTELGEVASPATFTGLAAANDAQSARWGLFQQEGTGFLWKGLMTLGTSTNAVYFDDTDVVITVDNTPKTYADFNRIEINNASSTVNWNGVSIIALRSSVTNTVDGTFSLSPGRLVVVDNADVNLIGCSLISMDFATFQSNSTCNSTTFKNMATVTTGGGTFDGCTFENITTLSSTSNLTNCIVNSSQQVNLTTAGAGLTNSTIIGTDDTLAQVLWNGTNTLTGCEFRNSSADRHAVELGTVSSPTSITWNHLLTTGDYTAGPASTTSNYTPVSNTNAAIVINGNLSSTLTINAANYDTNGVTPSVRVTGTNTGTIVINLAAQPEISVNVLEDDGSTNLTNATIYLEDSASNVIISAQVDADGVAGPFTNTFGNTSGTLRVRKFGWKPYSATVSIGTTTTLNVQMTPDPQQVTDRALQTGWVIDTTNSDIEYTTGGSVIPVQELYEAVMSDFAQTSFMQFPHPLDSATARDYSFVNGWTFHDKDDDYKQLSGGSIVDAANNLTWSNVRSIGSLAAGTNLYILQNDTVLTSWWGTGNFDILVKIEDGTFISTLDDTNTAINGGVWVFAREFGDLYDSFFVDLSALGQSVIALSTSNDTNNDSTEGSVSGGFGISIDYNGPFSYDAGDGNGSKNYETRVNLNGATLKQWYEYSKYLTRRGSLLTVDGDAGQEYRNANEATFSNVDVRTSPFGTFAGGRYFGAQGIQILNPAASDANNWELIASDGTPGISPPVTRSFTLTGLKDGTEVRITDITNDSEVAGVEEMNGGVGTGETSGVVVTGSTDNNTFTYSYVYSSDIDIFVAVVNLQFQVVRITGQTLGDGNTEIPVSQVVDRTYRNP